MNERVVKREKQEERKVTLQFSLFSGKGKVSYKICSAFHVSKQFSL